MGALESLTRRLKVRARRLPGLQRRPGAVEEEVRRSGLFNPAWYLTKYPDIRNAGLDPLRHFLDWGWRENRDPNPLFDTDWYLDAYPDVRSAGVNPLLHYIKHGCTELRDPGPRFSASGSPGTSALHGAHHLAAALKYVQGVEALGGDSDLILDQSSAPRILIIAELSIPQCRKYRVDQKRELLKILGFSSTVLDWRDLDACNSALSTHAAVIFYRTPGTDGVLQCVRSAKALGLPTYWEVDDLIFDPNEYMLNANLRTLSADLKRSVLSGVPLYRQGLLACDAAIASTEALATEMRKAGMAEVHVVENALDSGTLAAAQVAVADRRAPDGYVRIVYGSGTKTHDLDFLQAAPAILACLRAHSDLRLRIIGELGLPEVFGGCSAQIERFPASSYATYMGLLADCDIAIAPLEPSLFNDAKSNIKFIEAAMTGLPSVCSPAATFASLVDTGRNGFLATGEAAWSEALEQLIASPSLRTRIAASARADVLVRYAPAAIAQRQLAPVIAALASRSVRPRKPLKILSVNIFFQPRSFGGGTVVAEHVAARLHARADTEVVVFTSAPPGLRAAYRLNQYSLGDMPVIAMTLPEPVDPAAAFDNPWAANAFLDVLRTVQPDVVHFHCIQGLGVSLLKACQAQSVPYVVTAHDAWWICGRQFMITGESRYCFQTKVDLNVCSACVDDAGLNVYRQYRLRETLEVASFILTPSRFFADLYLANGFSPSKVRVNRNGVALATPGKTASSHLRFGFVGGGAEVKGAHILKSALLHLTRSDYELVLVDNGRALGFHTVFAEDWPARGTVTILPSYTQETMDDFFSHIDVLLFPTQWKESFGLTVREALMRNVWVITTDAGGVVEDVVDGVNGTIIPLTASGEVLAAAMAQALERRAELATFENPYRAQIANYDTQAEELHGFLAEAAARGLTIPPAEGQPVAVAT